MGGPRAVWSRLEEQNPRFFQAYQVRVQLKQQILQFNALVSEYLRAAELAKTPQTAIHNESFEQHFS